MSFAVTIDNLQSITELPENIVEDFFRMNPLYPIDAKRLFRVAQKTGMMSATIAGGRTTDPVTGQDVIVLSIVGMSAESNFNESMKNIIKAGPDE